MQDQGPPVDQNIDDQAQAAQAIIRLIYIAFAAFLFAITSGLFWKDTEIVIAGFVSIGLMAIPFWLLKKKLVLASGYLLVLMTLVSVTGLAMLGQGIHDIAILGYVIIIIFSCLALDQIGFRVSVGLCLLALGWLVLGETFGVYKSRPYEIPTPFDFLTVAGITLIAALSVNILASYMRRNLTHAKQEIVQRKRAEEQLRYQSTHDTMTGIFNRNFFETELSRLDLGREFPISVIIADIDGLKAVNDTLGHIAGDTKLQLTADLLRSAFRAEDILARIGGDEFAALLPSTDAETADHIMSRIRIRLVTYNLTHSDLPLHLSLGAATAEGNDLIQAFTLADQRMYADKARRKSTQKQDLT